MLKRLPLLRARARAPGVLARSAGRAHGRAVAHLLAEPLPYPHLPPDAVSFRDVAAFVDRAASVLRADLRVRPGDRCLVCPDNRVDFLWWILACSAAGAVPVPVHPGSRPDELGWIAADSGARAMVTDAAVLARGRPDVPQIGVCAGDAARARAHDLPRLVAGAVPARSTPAPAPGAPGAVLYTSGTTGRPKGVVLSPRALASIGALAPLVPPVPRQLLVDALPMAHVMGLSTALIALAAGVPTLHLPRFEAPAVLDALVRERATVYVGVPTTYRRLEDAGAGARDLTAVRLWMSAADVMPPDLIARFKGYGRTLAPIPVEAFFAEIYGMVELAGAAMLRVSPPGLSPTAAGFVGLPLPGWRARVVGEDGAPLRAGETGELELTGPGVTDGYLGASDETARVRRADGWLRTGDLAVRDRVGLVRFVGRSKDVVKSGGYSVYPAEVETALREHPAIGDAVVFGLPDDDLGEVPVAAVVLTGGDPPSEAALVAWARERLAGHKAPRRILAVLPDDLPVGPTRKVLRRSLPGLLAPRLAVPPADIAVDPGGREC